MRLWMNNGTTYCFRNVLKDIEYADEFGYDGLELKYSLIKDCSLKKIREHAKNKDIEIGAIGAVRISSINENRTQEFRKFVDMISVAEDLDCRIITVIPDRIGNGNLRENAKDIFTHELLRYSEEALKHDKSLALEVTGFHDSIINSFFEGYNILDELDLVNVGMIFDFYHFFGAYEDIRTLNDIDGNRIYIVHVNDGFYPSQKGCYPDEKRYWPGEGEYPIHEVFECFRQKHIYAPYSMEVYSDTPWEISHKECYKIGKDKLERSIL